MKTTLHPYYTRSKVHPYNTRYKKMNPPLPPRPTSRRGFRPPMCSPLYTSHPIPRSDPQIEEVVLTPLQLSEPPLLPVIKEENSPKNTSQ